MFFQLTALLGHASKWARQVCLDSVIIRLSNDLMGWARQHGFCVPTSVLHMPEISLSSVKYPLTSFFYLRRLGRSTLRYFFAVDLLSIPMDGRRCLGFFFRASTHGFGWNVWREGSKYGFFSFFFFLTVYVTLLTSMTTDCRWCAGAEVIVHALKISQAKH